MSRVLSKKEAIARGLDPAGPRKKRSSLEGYGRGLLQVATAEHAPQVVGALEALPAAFTPGESYSAEREKQTEELKKIYAQTEEDRPMEMTVGRVAPFFTPGAGAVTKALGAGIAPVAAYSAYGALGASGRSGAPVGSGEHLKDVAMGGVAAGAWATAGAGVGSVLGATSRFLGRYADRAREIIRKAVETGDARTIRQAQRAADALQRAEQRDRGRFVKGEAERLAEAKPGPPGGARHGARSPKKEMSDSEIERRALGKYGKAKEQVQARIHRAEDLGQQWPEDVLSEVNRQKGLFREKVAGELRGPTPTEIREAFKQRLLAEREATRAAEAGAVAVVPNQTATIRPPRPVVLPAAKTMAPRAEEYARQAGIVGRRPAPVPGGDIERMVAERVSAGGRRALGHGMLGAVGGGAAGLVFPISSPVAMAGGFAAGVARKAAADPAARAAVMGRLEKFFAANPEAWARYRGLIGSKLGPKENQSMDTPPAIERYAQPSQPGRGGAAAGEKDIDSLVSSASSRHGVPEDLVRAVVHVESRGRPDALSTAGARGVMQLMPQTARALGVQDVHDPAQNIDGGVRYLAQLLRQFNGDEDLAIQAYNAGPENVTKYRGKVPFAATRAYLAKVKGILRQ